MGHASADHQRSYNATRNEITFPAAILQPPFFDAEADDAVNYGGIGGAIGHEMSHGFDDRGSQFDADGNLHDWFTKADHDKFAEKAKALVAQYNAYEPVPDYHVNGALTLGETSATIPVWRLPTRHTGFRWPP